MDGGEGDCDKEKYKGWWSNSLGRVALLLKPQILSKKKKKKRHRRNWMNTLQIWRRNQNKVYVTILIQKAGLNLLPGGEQAKQNDRWDTEAFRWKIKLLYSLGISLICVYFLILHWQLYVGFWRQLLQNNIMNWIYCLPCLQECWILSNDFYNTEVKKCRRCLQF